MVACVSPADNNYDETLSTLRYANRAKNIKNKPRINQDPKDALLSQYQDEIRQLRELLEHQQSNMFTDSNVALHNFQNQATELEAEKEKIRQEYELQLQSLRKSYEAEKLDHARLQANVENLKDHYQSEMSRVQVEVNNQHLSIPVPGPGMLSRRPSVVLTSGESPALNQEQQEALARYVFHKYCQY